MKIKREEFRIEETAESVVSLLVPTNRVLRALAYVEMAIFYRQDLRKLRAKQAGMKAGSLMGLPRSRR
jgi:hypothetical protein